MGKRITLSAVIRAEERARKVREDQLAFAIELNHFLEQGGYRNAGYRSAWGYLLAEVCPALGWDRAKMARLLMAARELPNVVPFRKPGARMKAPSYKTLSLLHTERRRQARGKGRVAPRTFAKLVRSTAKGKLSKRDLERVLGCAA